MSLQPPKPDSGLYNDWKSWAQALLKYLQRQSENQALEPKHQLAGYSSTDLPNAGQDGMLIYKTDTEKVSASFGGAWYDFASIDLANTWGAQQIIELSSSLAEVLILRSTHDDALFGPVLVLHRLPATSAGNDQIGNIIWRGKSSTDASVDYARIFGGIQDNTNGLEDAQLRFDTIIAGAMTASFSCGSGIRSGLPTGAFMGLGTCNIQAEYYTNGAKVIGARKTGWSVDTGTDKRTANATYSGTAEVIYTQATIQALMDAVRDQSQALKALKDDLHATAGHGLIGT